VKTISSILSVNCYSNRSSELVL